MMCFRWMAGLLALLLATSAAAQSYPTSPVKIVVPFAPGGPTDTVGRLIAAQLQERWGQPVVIDYRPGAGTVIGVDAVAKARADGHTLGLVNASLTANPALRKKLPYDTLHDLAGVTQLFNLQLAIVARPDAPFSDLKELIAYAKAHPGRLNYGTPGAGSPTHLGAELLKREAGIDMQHVSLKGSAPAHTELMGGRLDLVVDPLLSVQPYVQAGRMKMIATLGAQRVPGHSYPTVTELIPGFEVSAMLGLVAPAATPRPVLQKIQADTAATLASAEIRKRAQEFGLEIVGSTPQQFDAFIASETRRWGKVVREARIEPE